MRSLLLPALVGGLSCSTPVEAPVAFDDLCAFVFEHASDEDPEALAQGVVNLQSWLERNRDSVEEGYVVNNMDPAWVEAHEGKPYDLTDLLGVALALEYRHPLERILGRILTDPKPADIDEEGRITHERVYNSDHECFIAGTCDFVSYDTQAVQNYPLGIEATVTFRSELRRIQTELGPAVIARNWMTGPSDFNWEWLSLDLSYYLAVIIEKEPGVVERTEATWMLAGFAGAPVSIEVGLSMALDKMRNSALGFRESLDTEFEPTP